MSWRAGHEPSCPPGLMSSLLERLLAVPTWTVLLVVGLLVFAEDALFVGFVLPGETAAILGGVAARLGHVPLAGARRRHCGSDRRGQHRVRDREALRSTHPGAARPAKAAKSARQRSGVLGTRRWPGRVPCTVGGLLARRDAGARRRRQDALPHVPRVQRRRRHRLGHRHGSGGLCGGSVLRAGGEVPRPRRRARRGRNPPCRARGVACAAPSPGSPRRRRSESGVILVSLTYPEAVVVGALQGVSELFPVSSLGHAVLVPA